MAGRHDDEILVTEGSGNVFADLGVAEPEGELAKAQLAGLIREALRRRRLTQTEAATLTGLDQPKASALVNGRLGGFSGDRLMRCLTALGQDVEIVVRTQTRRSAGAAIRARKGGVGSRRGQSELSRMVPAEPTEQRGWQVRAACRRGCRGVLGASAAAA